MLNAWDVHAKGGKMLELGIAMNKIQESVAFEVSTKGSTKQQQLQANIQLVESSHNQLAPVTGQERLLSCSSRYLVAFCRAILHGCQTQEPSLKAKTNGQLSLAALANSQDGLVTMCEQGWTWLVVSSLVEEAFPDLPTLVQQALNTTQAVSQGQGECMAKTAMAQETWPKPFNWQPAASQREATTCRPWATMSKTSVVVLAGHCSTCSSTSAAGLH